MNHINSKLNQYFRALEFENENFEDDLYAELDPETISLLDELEVEFDDFDNTRIYEHRINKNIRKEKAKSIKKGGRYDWQ